MVTETKRTRYADLVIERKRCRLCVGLRNPAEGELADLDSDEIGPWSRLHADLDAKIMIIGQDWGDVRYYTANNGRDDVQNPTTRTLEKLLHSIGLEASLPESDTGSRGLFLTNAVLCLKTGGLQAEVKPAWFTNCGERFLRAQVEIVSPRVVVTLGKCAYKAVLTSFGLRVGGLQDGRFRRAVEDQAGTALPNGSRLFAVYHCGQLIRNTCRPLAQQKRDWQRVAKAIGREAAADVGE